MQGKICLVTGATNGIGKVTALELARKGATVIVVGRNPEKTARVVAELQQQSGSANVKQALADLSQMAQVRELADEFKRKYSRLDVLVNNAGAWYDSREVSADGFEMTFALNHLSYFVLTHALLDVLKATGKTRIVNVSSEAHRMATLDFDDLQGERRYNGWLAYSRSKLMNVLFTYQLARELANTDVTANALHPGFVATGFGAASRGIIGAGFNLASKLMAITPEKGAETNIHLASAPEVAGITGKYWDKCKPVRSAPASHDQAAQRRLWDISLQLAAPYLQGAPTPSA